MALVIPLNGIRPNIHPSVFLAPTAVVIGDVTIGAESSVWFGAVLRGDSPEHRVIVGARTSVQENCVIHVGHWGPTIVGDDVQLVQIFQNLIANSIKFRGGSPPKVHVFARRIDKRTWEVAVRDNGIGIAPEYFDKVFVIFQRLHTRTEYAGNGIGLAICKKIVERHGGRIWIESEPDEGATVCFTLPAVPRRRLEKPSPGRVRDLVERIVRDRLADGQLDNCELTFKDLERIIAAVTRTLSGTLHARIDYPDVVTALPPQAASHPSSDGSAHPKPAEPAPAPALDPEAAPVTRRHGA